jgi:hypothetical protein
MQLPLLQKLKEKFSKQAKNDDSGNKILEKN